MIMQHSYWVVTGVTKTTSEAPSAGQLQQILASHLKRLLITGDGDVATTSLPGFSRSESVCFHPGPEDLNIHNLFSCRSTGVDNHNQYQSACVKFCIFLLAGLANLLKNIVESKVENLECYA